ncbi:MAG: type II toxin-antitoxin system HicB family antitoxin [Thaumarchaeota archaeon]|nr:type II toxin-antitoxin system HicB family antitoxin [Nitrososphaerota archaeon]
MKYRITLQKDEDGIYVAKCPSLQGCISQGKTKNEALDNIKDAIEVYSKSKKTQ